MPSSLLVLGDLKGGKLRVENVPALNRWIAAQKDGTRFRAVFEPADWNRRERLERFYRYVLLRQLGEHLGNEPKVQHLALWRHLQPEATAAGVPDLRWLNDTDLSAYVQDCVRIAAEMGCVLTERP